MMLLRWAFTVLLAGLALEDGLYRRVPNVVVLPLAATGAGYVVWAKYTGTLPNQALALIAATWIVALAAWRWHIFYGGDVKLVMALVLFFPDLRFLLSLLLGLLLGQTAALCYRRGWAGLRRVAALACTVWTSGQIPSPEEIRAASAATGQGRITFAIALGAAVYLWVL